MRIKISQFRHFCNNPQDKNVDLSALCTCTKYKSKFHLVQLPCFSFKIWIQNLQ
jgi:hypothetical protein